MSEVEWRMIVAKSDLVKAIRHARTRSTLRGKAFDVDTEIVLAAGPDGLSLRSSGAAMDIAGEGNWPSPIRAHGPSLRKLAPKLTGGEVVLGYASGVLKLNTLGISAKEV